MQKQTRRLSEMVRGIWETDNLSADLPGGDFKIFQSARCGGPYRISNSALPQVSGMSEEQRLQITEKIWRLRPISSEYEVIIDSKFVVDSAQIAPLSITERFDRGLLALVRNYPKLGQRIRWQESNPVYLEFMGSTYSSDLREVLSLLAEYDNRNLITRGKATSGTVANMAITFDGHLAFQEGRISSFSEQAFVAMWFTAEMNHVYQDAIDPAIRSAGYLPFRVDNKEHNNKIDDEIIAGIRASRFLVADFTSEPEKPRGGVYYEAGFAQGLGIPVIWTCREDLIGQVHFDTRQFNHIVWSSTSELQTKLQNRILATLGSGPRLK